MRQHLDTGSIVHSFTHDTARRSLTAGLAMSLAFAAAGCGAADDGGFTEALPDAELVTMDFPTSGASKARPGSSAEEVDSATCYDGSRELAGKANEWVRSVLDTLDRITDYHPTSVDGDLYTWGPRDNSEGTLTQQLLVTAAEDGSFAYEFQAAPIGTSDFQSYISGSIDAGSTRSAGSGSFTVDLDVVEALDPGRGVGGEMVFVYEGAEDTSRSIDVTLTDYLFAEGQVQDATLNFDRNADGTGQLDWYREWDVAGDPAVYEDLAYRARWQSDKAGRCDGTYTGGDLGSSVATAHQCWDTSTAEVWFLKEYGDNEVTRGSEAACVFSEASYAGE